MSEIGERISYIREEAGLSLSAFGDRIGIKKSSLSSLEHGINNPSERTLKMICKEFHVNYPWLVSGEGEIYSNLGGTILEMLVDEYNLCDLDRQIMEMYLVLEDDKRAGIRAFVQGLIDSNTKEKQGNS